MHLSGDLQMTYKAEGAGRLPKFNYWGQSVKSFTDSLHEVNITVFTFLFLYRIIKLNPASIVQSFL